jgi:pimeloyl-ACP methyl ester carboxylesterase
VVAKISPTLREVLYGLPVPRVYVFGERSLPDPDFEALPEHGISVAVVPDAGHGMTQDNPAGLAQVISEHLRR